MATDHKIKPLKSSKQGGNILVMESTLECAAAGRKKGEEGEEKRDKQRKARSTHT
jgi:hypothetical protein